MKYFLGVLVLILAACQPQTDTNPTGPASINIFNTQNQGSNQNTTTPGTDPKQCDGLVGNVDLVVIGGTFSGGKGKVGEPLLLSMDVAAVGGGSIPAVCLDTPPSVNAYGTCSVPTGVTQKLGRITVLPGSVGLCIVSATFLGKSDSVTVDVIS